MDTETVTVFINGEGFEVIVRHDQSGSACGMPLSKNAYEQLRQHFVGDSTPDFGFAEWCGRNYIRMNKVWCHRYVDQRDEKNWKTSEQLYKFYNEGIDY